MDRSIETAIGLAAIYLFFSVVVSAIVEFIAAVTALRARELEKGLANMLTKPLADSIKSHPLLATVTSAAGNRFFVWKHPPTFLHSGLFAEAFLDRVESLRAVAQGKQEEIDKAYDDFVMMLGPVVDGVQKKLAPKTAADIKHRLQGILGAVETHAKGARAGVEEWFNAGMEHLSGAYKRQTALITGLVTVVLVLALNIDAVAMTRTLWNDPVARQHALELGKEAREACAPPSNVTPGTSAVAPADCDKLLASITDKSTTSLIMPLGWSSRRWGAATEAPWLIVIGMVLSMAAIGLGAPFWYELLRRWAPGLQEPGRTPPP